MRICTFFLGPQIIDTSQTNKKFVENCCMCLNSHTYVIIIYYVTQQTFESFKYLSFCHSCIYGNIPRKFLPNWLRSFLFFWHCNCLYTYIIHTSIITQYKMQNPNVYFFTFHTKNKPEKRNKKKTKN